MRIEKPAPDLEQSLRELWQLAFGDSEAYIGRFFREVYSPDRCRCLILGEKAAAVLHWMDTEYMGQKFAYLYAIATHPDCRRQGLCRRLMEDTHRHLTEEGYAGALLQPAGENLRTMYAGMGYRDCCTGEEFTCMAGAPLPIQAVDAAQYGRLRRSFLPPEGVLQEGENLKQLAFYAQTYSGADFLLAAAKEGDTLYACELLGNQEAAPGILGALGCPRGIFRCPGREKQTVMLLPFQKDIRRPGYFGLTFD